MKDMYNNWRSDVHEWMNESTLNRYDDLKKAGIHNQNTIKFTLAAHAWRYMLGGMRLTASMVQTARAQAGPIWARKIRKVCKEVALLEAFKVALKSSMPKIYVFCEAFCAKRPAERPRCTQAGGRRPDSRIGYDLSSKAQVMSESARFD